jgi:argonaute-like protein implicated in RNA metabolism and viral defense
MSEVQFIGDNNQENLKNTKEQIIKQVEKFLENINIGSEVNGQTLDLDGEGWSEDVFGDAQNIDYIVQEIDRILDESNRDKWPANRTVQELKTIQVKMVSDEDRNNKNFTTFYDEYENLGDIVEGHIDFNTFLN